MKRVLTKDIAGFLGSQFLDSPRRWIKEIRWWNTEHLDNSSLAIRSPGFKPLFIFFLLVYGFYLQRVVN